MSQPKPNQKPSERQNNPNVNDQQTGARGGTLQTGDNGSEQP